MESTSEGFYAEETSKKFSEDCFSFSHSKLLFLLMVTVVKLTTKGKPGPITSRKVMLSETLACRWLQNLGAYEYAADLSKVTSRVPGIAGFVLLAHQAGFGSAVSAGATPLGLVQNADHAAPLHRGHVLLVDRDLSHREREVRKKEVFACVRSQPFKAVCFI